MLIDGTALAARPFDLKLDFTFALHDRWVTPLQFGSNSYKCRIGKPVIPPHRVPYMRCAQVFRIVLDVVGVKRFTVNLKQPPAVSLHEPLELRSGPHAESRKFRDQLFKRANPT